MNCSEMHKRADSGCTFMNRRETGVCGLERSRRIRIAPSWKAVTGDSMSGVDGTVHMKKVLVQVPGGDLEGKLLPPPAAGRSVFCVVRRLTDVLKNYRARYSNKSGLKAAVFKGGCISPSSCAVAFSLCQGAWKLSSGSSSHSPERAKWQPAPTPAA